MFFRFRANLAGRCSAGSGLLASNPSPVRPIPAECLADRLFGLRAHAPDPPPWSTRDRASPELTARAQGMFKPTAGTHLGGPRRPRVVSLLTGTPTPDTALAGAPTAHAEIGRLAVFATVMAQTCNSSNRSRGWPQPGQRENIAEMGAGCA